jgi:hypothetical protein
MAAHSRHSFQSGEDVLYKGKETELEQTAYELQRDRRKKTLHDSIQLAFIEVGFGEAASVRFSFPGEGMSHSPPLLSKTRRRWKRGPQDGAPQCRWSARILTKEIAPPAETSTAPEQVKKVRARTALRSLQTLSLSIVTSTIDRPRSVRLGK